MSESMQEMMEREKAEAIATLNRANSALSRIFGITEEESGENEEDTAQCTRCESEVEEGSLIRYGDWKLCEACQGDI